MEGEGNRMIRNYLKMTEIRYACGEAEKINLLT